MEQKGLNQKAVARELSISREAVSQWFKGNSIPRPDKLLKLGKLLALTFDQLVLKDQVNMPQVAFRRMKATKTRDHHVEKAQTMGMMLRHLVPFLPFDTLAMPPVLKNPSCDYAYLQQVVSKVRVDILVEQDEVINFTHLIRRFSELQAVLIPVLWGSKQRHENALHIYLPDSQTTWVYLNLDVNVHDFKFWMAHELGHCLSPSLKGDEAEDFADSFAAALLFPHEMAEQGYGHVVKARSDKGKLKRIIQLAEENLISPYTIYLQLNRYAKQIDKTTIELTPGIHGWTINFNKKYPNLSQVLFEAEELPEPHVYLDKIRQAFDTPFFDTFSQYLRQHRKGPGMVQTVMDIPILDARGLHAELT